MNDRSRTRLQILQQHLDPSLGENSATNYNNNDESYVTQEDTNAFSEELSSARERNSRAVLVSGVRTPFTKSFGKSMKADAIDLGVSAVSGLLEKTKLDPNHIDEIIWGNVVLSVSAPNVAREIVIDLNLPKKITGVTVSRACLSGMQAIMQAIMLVESGQADCVIAGGSDSTSNGEMTMPRHFVRALAKYNYHGRKKGFAGVKNFFKEAGSPLSWLPQAPSISERSTGKTMGFHADLMAEINSVTREAQDTLATASHKKAAQARRNGYFDEEVVPLVLSDGTQITEDDLIRENADASKVKKLRPAFRKTGTVTPASSSPLTDGGSAVLVMSERKAKELGYSTDIAFKSFATTAVDPYPQLLIAPTLAIPKVLQDTNLTLDDIDFVEMHEAFAAQVLATLACLSSKKYCQDNLGLDAPIGNIPAEKLNPNGGSIAIGHPFAATGGRCVISAMNELRRSKKKHALISICAAGGLGGAAVVERRDEE
eukprot:gb/GECH01012692.1/.p1 GENE.gb/GECH01012692.1/~~gb/GECH01012692.1/.p1  ORF type:complete len:485 (+),score=146.55 gb/GECH01012692.1/:1-1455(+)